MNYSKSKLNNPYIADILLENIFISEFLPDAPGDFVKIYLYGRMQAEGRGTMPEKEMADQLGVTEERILEAWEYWENWGAVRRRYIDSDNKIMSGVEFLNLKEQMFDSADFDGEELWSEIDDGEDSHSVDAATSDESMTEDGNARGEDGEPALFESEEAKALMPEIESRLGRSLSLTEMQRVVSWVKDQNISRDVILYAIDYSLERGKNSLNYIAALVEGWTSQGLVAVPEIEKYVEKFSDKFKNYSRVLQALGQRRNATEEEMRIMDTWFQDYGFTMNKVLEACAKTAGIASPNIKYVDRVLANWGEEAQKNGRDVNSNMTVTNAQLMEYYAFIKERAEREAEERRQELYKALPEVEEMDKKLGQLGVKLGRALISRDEKAIKEINEDLERLNEDRAITLAENNFEINYTDPRYKCINCNDTGIAEMGGLCKICTDDRRLEAEIWLREREKDGYK